MTEKEEVAALGMFYRGGVLIAVFKKPLSGEPDRLERKRFVMLVGSVINRVGYYPNIDPLVALLSQLNCTLITTGRFSRCGGRRTERVDPKPVRLFPVRLVVGPGLMGPRVSAYIFVLLF